MRAFCAVLLFGFVLLVPGGGGAVPVSLGIAVPAIATSTITAANAALDLARAAGAQYVRVSADWPRLMPRAGQQNFAWLDAIVAAATARHLHVVLVLGRAPRWAVSYLDGTASTEEVLRAHPDLPAYRAYVTAVARHYQRQVTEYQLWDRPSGMTLLANPRDVYALYREGAHAIHAVSPELQAIAAEPGDIDLCWLNGYWKSVTGSERPDVLLLAPVSVACLPTAFALRTQVLHTQILPPAAPALWAEIPLMKPGESSSCALAAMALLSGCPHLLFTAGETVAVPPAVSFQAAAAFFRPLCGREYTGWMQQGHSVAGAFMTAESQALLLFPRADESLEICPAGAPHAGELTASMPQIVWTAPGASPVVQQVTDAISLDVTAEHPLLLTGATEGLTAGFPDLLEAPMPEDTVTLDATGTDARGMHALRALPGGHYAQYLTEDGRAVLRTVRGSMPWIYFDVPTRFLFFNTAQTPLEITVQVLGATSPNTTGFNLYYDTLDGMRTTAWQSIDQGPETTFSYTFRVNDALFAGGAGYDFRLQMGGSAEDVRVLGVRVKKLGKTQ